MLNLSDFPLTPSLCKDFPKLDNRDISEFSATNYFPKLLFINSHAFPPLGQHEGIVPAGEHEKQMPSKLGLSVAIMEYYNTQLHTPLTSNLNRHKHFVIRSLAQGYFHFQRLLSVELTRT